MFVAGNVHVMYVKVCLTTRKLAYSDRSSFSSCLGSTSVGRFVNLQLLHELQHIAHEGCVKADVDPVDLCLEGGVHPVQVMGDSLVGRQIVLDHLGRAWKGSSIILLYVQCHVLHAGNIMYM